MAAVRVESRSRQSSPRLERPGSLGLKGAAGGSQTLSCVHIISSANFNSVICCDLRSLRTARHRLDGAYRRQLSASKIVWF